MHSAHSSMPLNHEPDEVVVAADATPALPVNASAISNAEMRGGVVCVS